jgi:hypothetical protein
VLHLIFRWSFGSEIALPRGGDDMFSCIPCACVYVEARDTLVGLSSYNAAIPGTCIRYGRSKRNMSIVLQVKQLDVATRST